MNKLIYMMGIPGSGKSFWAKEIAKKEKAIIVSTDEIRGELFGDASKQKHTALIYREAFQRIKDALASGRNVILDATNIDREWRVKSLAKFEGVIKEGYVVNTPYERCLERNQQRKRKVQEYSIEKARKEFHFPILAEGWDDLHLIHEEHPYLITKEAFTKLLQTEASYHELFEALREIPCFGEMKNFNQENPHHQHTLCWHTYRALEWVNVFYEGEDKFLMQVMALFHDTGKPFCKKFKPERGHYSYFGHEYVSAQIACHFLTQLGFDKDFVFQAVNLIQMHMKINYGEQQDISEIYHLLGGEHLTKLYFFKEADREAK